MFTPPTKQAGANFISKQTNGFQKIKEIRREVSPATGTISMKELRDSLNQFTDIELENMRVQVKGQNPKDMDKRDQELFLYRNKSLSSSDEVEPLQFISITKMMPDLYELDDGYINNSVLRDPDHSAKSIIPGTEGHPATYPQVHLIDSNASKDAFELEVLKAYDRMKEENPEHEPTRDEVLEFMKKENE